VGFGRQWFFGLQFGIVLNGQDKGRRAFIHRHGETFSQQIVRERSPDVVSEPGDEPAQLYAVNTPRQTLCNPNAHSGPF